MVKGRGNMTDSTKLKLTEYMSPPEDPHEKKIYYNQEAKDENNMDELEFRNSVDTGEHNIKCLHCYLMGLRFCVYWSYSNLCSEFEKKEVEKAFMEFK